MSTLSTVDAKVVLAQAAQFQASLTFEDPDQQVEEADRLCLAWTGQTVDQVYIEADEVYSDLSIM